MKINPLRFYDGKGHELVLGDRVVRIKETRAHLKEYYMVFSIPQWRFGFIQIHRYDEMKRLEHPGIAEDWVIGLPSLDFYWTPANSKQIEKCLG